jgi:hypothetical protein
MEEQYGKQRMDKSENSWTTQEDRSGRVKQIQYGIYQRVAVGNGTFVRVWESRAETGAFQRAVS